MRRPFLIVLLVIAGFISGLNCSVASHQNPTSSIEVHFSPNGGIRDRIVRAIEQSKSTVDMAMFAFTSDEVAQALVEAKKRGVRVRVILDSQQAKGKHSQYEYLVRNGFDVRIGKGKGGGYMHHKVCIFDDGLVMTGSYNISDNAEYRNSENAVFIADKTVVKKYQEMFEELWVEK